MGIIILYIQGVFLKKLYTLLLTLSLATVTAHSATTTLKYKIKSGDSLYKIAQKNNTTVSKLRKANGIKQGETLKLGRMLKVPTKTTASKKTSFTLARYKIKKGDSLSVIARKHHTTVEKIRQANGMKRSETLRLGRVLKVPQNKTVKKTIAKAPKNKQKIILSQAKKTTSNKKLVASISNLDTISLSKAKVKKDEKLSLGDILFGGKKDKTVKCDKSVNAKKCVRITSLAKKKLGKRYVWGATGGRNTFDCSGLTTYVYKQNGIKLPRRAIAQSRVGKRVKRENLKKGDLVFFDTSKRRKGYVNHVGIYIGDNKFIHASSAKKKVVITSLSKPFYSKRFTGARRLAS